MLEKVSLQKFESKIPTRFQRNLHFAAFPLYKTAIEFYNTSENACSQGHFRDGFHQKRRFALQSGRAPARGKTCFCPVFRFNTSLACKGIFAMDFNKRVPRKGRRGTLPRRAETRFRARLF